MTTLASIAGTSHLAESIHLEAQRAQGSHQQPSNFSGDLERGDNGQSKEAAIKETDPNSKASPSDPASKQH